MTETATLTLLNGQMEDFERVLAVISAYLDEARHCQSYLLTRSLDGRQSYVLNSVWDAETYRVIAWHHFSDLLAQAGIVVHIGLVGQSEQQKTA